MDLDAFAIKKWVLTSSETSGKNNRQGLGVNASSAKKQAMLWI
jgi:hypothetical protein